MRNFAVCDTSQFRQGLPCWRQDGGMASRSSAATLVAASLPGSFPLTQAWQEHPTQVPVGGSQYGMGGAQYGMPVGGAQYGMPTMQPHPDAAVGPSAPSPWPMSPAAPQRDAPPSRLQPSSSDGSDGSSGGGTSALPAVGVYRERSMSDIQRVCTPASWTDHPARC